MFCGSKKEPQKNLEKPQQIFLFKIDYIILQVPPLIYPKPLFNNVPRQIAIKSRYYRANTLLS
jgi:hypothetical protein